VESAAIVRLRNPARPSSNSLKPKKKYKNEDGLKKNEDDLKKKIKK
jgi:hypothetical protein